MAQREVECMIRRPEAIRRDEEGRPLYLGAVRGAAIDRHAETRKGRVANIELLNPADHLDLLKRAAERLGLDREALLATAEAALAAPDRQVSVEVAGAAAPAGTV
jgi:pyrroloquinoline quinone (PQQ) biosynthesis protein C